MKYNTWNPMTADEPDPYPAMLEDAISSRAESLMSDKGWLDAVLANGIDCRELVVALAETYVPGATYARVGGLLMDALWNLATEEATETIDDVDYDGE